ncbi:cytochrome c biogenesis CcdA family protein [Roseinatronobacter alkalisoli]|uniref:Cytochrome c biogenesis protein CcdA n=1 Tax=Roseinatronobacter alkalisoli TaxID=3028235 RepID=A0ABT5TAE9_9RHOB|nr:cytochrome c biogenesis protein CcdA [Roseinatronobacter sp. HJB301]MDD7972104.1 cytochrome c biogenesis protein CcdA [Roseinatronobacter sp. HJB301]
MFGIDVFDAAMLPALLIALGAGVLSFMSPCVLPIVPPYLAYMGGISMQDMTSDGRASRRAILPALFFVMGLSTVFLLLGFTASTMGHLFLRNADLFGQIAGVVVIAFGLHFLGFYRLLARTVAATLQGMNVQPPGFLAVSVFSRDLRFDAGDRGGSAFGAYVLGLAFAFGWTPCIGPVLGAILSLAATETTVARGTAMLGVYALGLGLPFLLAAMFVQRSMALMSRLKRHMAMIEKVMGLLLLIVGIALVTGAFSAFSWWLLETFPAMSRLG